MTLRFTVTITGADRVLGNFKRLEFNIPKSNNKISSTISKRIERRAREILMRAPYHRHHPGLIVGTKATKTSRPGQWVTVSQSFDELGVDYAPFVEFGTAPHEIPTNPYWGMRGKIHPGAHSTGPKATKGYFTRAVNQTKQEVRGIAEENTNQAIRRSGFT